MSNVLSVYYDGECPLCSREMAWLMRRVPEGAVEFIDITQIPGTEIHGKTRAELDRAIHARTPDGAWLVGLEVFRRLYALAGIGWLLWPTRLPIIKQLADFLYAQFAKHRRTITGTGKR